MTDSAISSPRSLADYIPAGEFREKHTHPSQFETDHSWNWFVRKNRSELVECGALRKISGRDYCHPDLMTTAVLKLGAR